MISQMGEEMNFCVLILIEGASSNGAAFNKCACSCYSLQERRNHQITLIAADEQPHIELLHARLMSYFLLKNEWMQRILPDKSMVNTPRTWLERGGIYKYRFTHFS